LSILNKYELEGITINFTFDVLDQFLNFAKRFAVIYDQGRFATSLGYDAIEIKNTDRLGTSYLNIFNRSCMVILKDNIKDFNAKSKKIISNAKLSRQLAELIFNNAFLLSIEDLDKLIDRLEKYDSIESMPEDLQEKIKLAKKYQNSLKDYPNLLAFNSFIKDMMGDLT